MKPKQVSVLMEATHRYHLKGLHKAIFALKLVQFIQSPIKLLQSNWVSLNEARCSVLMRFSAAKRTTYAALPIKKKPQKTVLTVSHSLATLT